MNSESLIDLLRLQMEALDRIGVIIYGITFLFLTQLLANKKDESMSIIGLSVARPKFILLFLLYYQS